MRSPLFFKVIIKFLNFFLIQKKFKDMIKERINTLCFNKNGFHYNQNPFKVRLRTEIQPVIIYLLPIDGMNSKSEVNKWEMK